LAISHDCDVQRLNGINSREAFGKATRRTTRLSLPGPSKSNAP
jgi:hypothetical protein